MKYLFFLILLILFCKEDKMTDKDQLVLYSSLYKVQSDINYKNTYCYSINVPSDTPACIKEMIKVILEKKRDERESSSKLISYILNGEKFYSRRCCGYTYPTLVFDKSCKILCDEIVISIIPNQGTGCTDFFSTATNETLIWEDRRTESGGCK